MRLGIVGNDRYSLPAQSLPGGIYCAPWCGCNCTRAEYDRAVKEAGALAAILGDGWEPRVWENIGWHYSANKGVAQVSPNIKHTAIRHEWTVYGYTAFFGGAHPIISSAETPKDALAIAIRDARGIEQRIATDLAALTTDSGHG